MINFIHKGKRATAAPNVHVASELAAATTTTTTKSLVFTGFDHTTTAAAAAATHAPVHGMEMESNVLL